MDQASLVVISERCVEKLKAEKERIECLAEYLGVSYKKTEDALVGGLWCFRPDHTLLDPMKREHERMAKELLKELLVVNVFLPKSTFCIDKFKARGHWIHRVVEIELGIQVLGEEVLLFPNGNTEEHLVFGGWMQPESGAKLMKTWKEKLEKLREEQVAEEMKRASAPGFATGLAARGAARAFGGNPGGISFISAPHTGFGVHFNSTFAPIALEPQEDGKPKGKKQ